MVKHTYTVTRTFDVKSVLGIDGRGTEVWYYDGEPGVGEMGSRSGPFSNEHEDAVLLSYESALLVKDTIEKCTDFPGLAVETIAHAEKYSPAPPRK